MIYELLFWIFGDPYEREAITSYQLDKSFRNYFEFWENYVLPNRRRNDFSKLREGFPAALEDIFNNHYYTINQLTVALRQIRELSNPNSVLEVVEPFYHLGTAIDTIERTFVAVLNVIAGLEGRALWVKPTREEFEARKNEYDWDKFSKDFSAFTRTGRPVTIRLFDMHKFFLKHLSKKSVGEEFKTITESIRNYRNAITHGLPPIRIANEAEIVKRLPKPEFRKKYEDARWSSGQQPDFDHFAPADEILNELADSLIRTANALWVELLELMKEIKESNQYKDEFGELTDVILPSPASGVTMYQPPAIKQSKIPYTGGSADYTLLSNEPTTSDDSG